MDNKVGSYVPSDKEIAKVVADLDAVEKQVTKYTITISADDKKHLARFRPGGERVVEIVAGLAEKHGLTLRHAPVSGMRADLALAKQVHVVRTRTERLRERLDDTELQAASECWSAATSYYSTLMRMAEKDPELARDLKEAVDFFALGKRRPPPAAK